MPYSIHFRAEQGPPTWDSTMPPIVQEFYGTGNTVAAAFAAGQPQMVLGWEYSMYVVRT